jgi:REP element-mobilizing transposase RayT
MAWSSRPSGEIGVRLVLPWPTWYLAPASALSATPATTVMRLVRSRPPRYALSGVPPHVIQRRQNRQPLFVHADDYRLSLACPQATTARHATAVHASGLMTHHVHGLMTPHQPTSLATVLQALGRRDVPSINATSHRTGTSPCGKGAPEQAWSTPTSISWRVPAPVHATRSALAWCRTLGSISGRVTRGMRMASTTPPSRTMHSLT